MPLLTFAPQPLGEDRKTQKWLVFGASGNLGIVYWYTAWRRYVFFPNAGTAYDASCLSEITSFLTRETDKQKETWK